MFQLLWTLLLLLGITQSTLAQSPPAGDSLRFLSVATFEDPSTSTNHAYLLWQASDPSLLRGTTYAVFSKTGSQPRRLPTPDSPQFHYRPEPIF